MSKAPIAVILLAAGKGQRMGQGKNKAFLTFGGKEILAHTLLAWQKSDLVDTCILVAAAGEEDSCRLLLSQYHLPKVQKVVTGGQTRQESVQNAIVHLPADCTIVAVHDVARPFFDCACLSEMLQLLPRFAGIVPVAPVTDTIKICENETVQQTLPREKLYAVQTPQLFWRDIWQQAYAKAQAEQFAATDDASVVEYYGGQVGIYRYEGQNIKITKPADLLFAQAIWEKGEEGKMTHSGIGYDVHCFAENRSLILGGVKIPYEKGLLGHSDADVLLHAVIDALLGAASLGDIGHFFPDSEQKYKDCSSLWLLEQTKTVLEKAQKKIEHIDATIIAQQPKMAPYLASMREHICRVLAIPESAVNIKATTTEGLGFTGRGEGIAALAVADICSL